VLLKKAIYRSNGLKRGVVFKFLTFAVFTILLQGCAAVPVIIATGVAAGAVAVTQVVNLARDQYPDIDFESPAPVEVTYVGSSEKVWDGVVDVLMESREQIAVSDKASGTIRTVRNNLNDVSWIGKGLGKATFLYEYNIVVRQMTKGVAVRITVPFWEEKVFIAKKQKNIPEGSNMMRHIFYRNLEGKIVVKSVKLPDTANAGIRYAPETRVVTERNKTLSVPESTPIAKKKTVGTFSRDTVREVQLKLKAVGYNPGIADGIMGTITRDALKQYQGDHNLVITGEPDKETLTLLLTTASPAPIYTQRIKNSLSKSTLSSANSESAPNYENGQNQALANADYVRVIGKSKVEVKEQPGLFSVVISVVSPGTRLRLLGKSDQWYKVKTDAGDGYIFLDSARKE